MEHTCGSLPSNANTVKLFSGNQYEKDFIQFEIPSDGGSATKSDITISRAGDTLKFNGIEVSLSHCDFFEGHLRPSQKNEDPTNRDQVLTMFPRSSICIVYLD